MDQFKLQKWLEQGKLNEATLVLEKELGKLTNSPYHLILNLKFTNQPQKVASVIDRFIARESARFKIAAVYTETNGFSCNPDSWWFSFFAYTTYGGLQDHDWLADTESLDVAEDVVKLTGMEDLQLVYRNAKDGKGEFEDEDSREKWNEANTLCDLLVICRFQCLIRESLPFCTRWAVPFLATAHGYDCIAEFRPDPA